MYGQGNGEANDLDDDADEASDEIALQPAHALPVIDASLAMRLGDPRQVDLGLVAIAVRCAVEVLDVDARKRAIEQPFAFERAGEE